MEGDVAATSMFQSIMAGNYESDAESAPLFSEDEDLESAEEEEVEEDEEEVLLPIRSPVKKQKPKSCKDNRQRRTCNLCGKYVKYLAHHLKRQHKIVDVKRRHAVLYQARKIKPITHSSQGKTKRRRKDCPVEGCAALSLARLENHLLSTHRMKRGSPSYVSALTEAKMRHTATTAATAPKTSAEQDADDSILAIFKEHLLLLTESERTVNSVMQQVGRMVAMAGGELELFTSKQLRDFVRVMRDGGSAPKTIMKYLDSFRKLADFLQIEEEEALVRGVTANQVRKMERLAAQLIKVQRPLAKKHEALQKSQIREKMVDFQDLTRFRGMMRKDAAPLLARLEEGETLEWGSVRAVRNYLILEVLINGAPRSGVVANLTMGQFNGAKFTRRGKELFFVMKVEEHKTAGSHGPTRIVFPETIFRKAETYAKHGRKQTAGLESGHPDITQHDSPFFLGYGGKKITHVAQEVYRTWEKKGFGKRITSTHVRYTAATKACERLPELEKRKVAKFMAHLGSTQEKYYQALQADTDAVDASVCISGMMCERNEEEEADSMEVQQDCPMQEEVNDEDDEYIPPTCSGSLVGVQKPKRKRKLFSEADEQLLRKAVARKQKMGVTGTMSEAIHEIYDRHREQFGKYPFKSVYDKVRHGCMWL